MKKLHISAIALALSTAISAPVMAEQTYGFADVSVNHLNWSDNSDREDFVYLELEGGAGYNWGDVYGFVDIENPEAVGEETSDTAFRVAAKGSIALNLGDSNFNAYTQVYHTNSGKFGFDQNFVLGGSYEYYTDFGFWFKPFLGVHVENNSGAGDAGKGYTGYNGFMGGWVLGYDFTVANQKFSISNWHETEFARQDEFRFGAASVGQNGALALWAHLPYDVTAGVQYRYFDNKLGVKEYGDAVILTVKYNF